MKEKQIDNPESNLPNYQQTLKYMELIYHSLISNGFYVILFFFVAIMSSNDFISLYQRFTFSFHYITIGSLVLVILSMIYVMSRPRNVYLVDFACFKPGPESKTVRTSYELFINKSKLLPGVKEESLVFQKKVLERSGLGENTYFPQVFLKAPYNPTLEDARDEAEMVMFGAIDELLTKTGVDAKDIDILIVNCSLLSPAPSLSALVINKYKMRENVMSYNFGGMGCSGSMTAIDLAKHLFQVHANSYCLIVSTENITLNWYSGNYRPMLVTNCLFRVGAAAILLSNRKTESRRAKYQLVHSLRTNQSADDSSYNCVIQRQDEDGVVGLYLSKELMVVAGESLTMNIQNLGRLVLPISEKLRFLSNLVMRKFFQMKTLKPYVPNFKLAFEHFLVHAGGRAVLDAAEKSLGLTSWDMEPSRMTLYRYGNTSSSSLWYQLAYTEAKGRVQKGDRIWQIAFGSGYKCNSGVWRALRRVDPAKEKNVWMDEISEFPVDASGFKTF